LNSYQNILVESSSPEWLVKITDFGISKRAVDGETDFRTNVGTSGYVAPEVIGCLSEDNQNISYSVAVDIWAIGIIAFQLLLKRLPFLSHYDIMCYFDGKKHLGIDNTPNANLSNTCQDFIKGLLSPNPVNRPTAESAMEHSWIAGDPPSMDIEESLVYRSLIYAII
jgi:serine/threonine protein kinase